MNCYHKITQSIFIFILALLPAISRAQDTVFPKDPSEMKGFRFLGGNSERGQEAFTLLNCVRCHSVKNANVPAPGQKQWLNLPLASEIRFVKRYEDLILAITNPRHVMNEQYRAILKEAEIQGGLEPLMPDMADDMSARQLMDLTAFLHQVYTRELPDYGRPAGN